MMLSEERLRRTVTGFGVFYLVFLLAVVATTSFRYRDYYVPPSLDAPLGEDAVLELWSLNYEHRYREYRRFIGPIGVSLALFLSAWAAAVGVWRRSAWKGLLALVAGGFATVLALSLLPSVYFPFDKYPVAALWVIGGAPFILVTWAVLTIIGRILTRRLIHNYAT